MYRDAGMYYFQKNVLCLFLWWSYHIEAPRKPPLWSKYLKLPKKPFQKANRKSLVINYALTFGLYIKHFGWNKLKTCLWGHVISKFCIEFAWAQVSDRDRSISPTILQFSESDSVALFKKKNSDPIFVCIFQWKLFISISQPQLALASSQTMLI